MVSFPPFPTGSLYTGSFPSFPTYQITIPLGFTSITFSVPNLVDIPQWIASLVAYGALWALGWAGAIFEFVVEYAEAGVLTISDSLLGVITNLLTEVINAIEGLTYKAGIFAPLISIAFMGALVIGAVVAVYLVVNAVSRSA